MKEYAFDVTFKGVVRINADNPEAAKQKFLSAQSESLDFLAKEAPFKVTEISADGINPRPFEVDGVNQED